MAIILKAKLEAKKTGTYEGRTYCTLQTLDRDERGALKLIEINLPDGADHSPYVEGKTIELMISISASKTGKVYYRAVLNPPAAAA